MSPSAFFLVAAFVFAFGLISGRLQRTIISPPMIFVGFGVIIGPHVLNLLDLHVNDELVHTVAELTLILVLFTDASRIDFRVLRQGYHLPLRLLAVGLPLTLVVGTLVGLVVFWGACSVWEAALLAAILAPTDAALGQSVVSSPWVPLRIRQALNVESGLNDGIALPAVMILLAIVGAHGEAKSNAAWLEFFVLQLTLGPLTGVVVGFCGGRLLQLGRRTQWMNHTFEQLSGISIALAAFAGAELIGGNGFIAAFVAGLTIGNTAKAACDCLYEFAESEGQLLTLLAFMLFGVVTIWPAAVRLSWPVIAYALLSLTIVRMVPVAIGLKGMGLHVPSQLFLGWFGPRGLASIVFGLLMLNEGADAAFGAIFDVVVITVLVSVFAHGITALPLSRRYAEWLERRMSDATAPCEFDPVPELPVRLPMRHAADVGGSSSPTDSSERA